MGCFTALHGVQQSLDPRGAKTDKCHLRLRILHNNPVTLRNINVLRDTDARESTSIRDQATKKRSPLCSPPKYFHWYNFNRASFPQCGTLDYLGRKAPRGEHHKEHSVK